MIKKISRNHQVTENKMFHICLLRSDKLCKLCALFPIQGQKKLSPKTITLFSWYMSGLYSLRTCSKLSFFVTASLGQTNCADFKSLCLRYKKLTSLVTNAKLWSLRGVRLPAAKSGNRAQKPQVEFPQYFIPNQLGSVSVDTSGSRAVFSY